MPNANYIKGRKKEYKLKKEFEEKGYIVLRTAGSHGFADLICIKKPKEKEIKEIRFIQCKPNNFPKSQERKLLKEYDWLDGYVFSTRFEVL
jgi:hypothetical protein